MPKSILDQLSTHAREQLLELEREKLRRDISPLKLYVPYDYQKPFHYDKDARESLVIGGNRSGKTASCAMEFAWAVTGTHPVKGKYPSENANAMIVAQNWNHIGRVIYNYLFRAGAFKIIKDLDTGIWRAFDFVKDADRKDEAKPAPPLIPERMIKKKAWVLKASNMISYVELENGWNIWFFSSDSDPPQGHAASLVWVDEDLNGSENWIAELQARLADRQGRLMWSAMPHSRNDALLGLAERAEKAEEAGKTHIKKYTFRFLDNPAIAQEEKALMLERWAGVGGEAEIRRRAEGDFVLDQQLVYPTFNLSLHTFEGEVGSDWTRYMVVDPGHAIAAVLFGAVPPTNDQIVIYDELYIRGCSATVLAEEVFKKVSGQQFWAFIVDSHGSRLTDIGSGRSPQQQYSEAFAERRIESTVTGSSFIPGCDDIASGIQAVRECLYVRGNGNSRLKVVRSAVPHFLKEIKKYRFKMQKTGGMNIVTDVPNNKADNHLMDCLRYLCTYDPQFHRQEKQEEKPWWFEWKARRDKNKSPAAVMLTPESYSFTFEA